jgi:hypothetical protein
MKTLIINPHSFVDIITNSSTVIYTYVNSIQAVKDVMNAVIAGLPGVTVTADELFEFEEVLDELEYDRYVDDVLDDEEHKHYEKFSKIHDNENLSWSEKREKCRDLCLELGITAKEVPDRWNDFPAETRLKVTPKFPEGREDIGDLLMNVFSHEADRDS